ncbi:MAG TPA: hypothetical protein VD905_18395 [Flavobacteriales bacterium]|nr:hypothetical protein [Flavobacteriales bacterium]
MEPIMLSLFAQHETRNVALVTFVVLGLITYFIYKASRGFFIRYSTLNMPKTLLDMIMFLHIFVSVVPALYLPNNVIAKTVYFAPLFAESDAWFIVCAMVLAVVIFMVTGVVLTFIAGKFFTKKTNEL